MLKLHVVPAICYGGRAKAKGVEMLAILAAILIVLWLLGFLAFHVTGGLIHILLVVGVIMLVLHFLRGRSATV
jgi:membrane-bound ClpP family serine protease